MEWSLITCCIFPRICKALFIFSSLERGCILNFRCKVTGWEVLQQQQLYWIWKIRENFKSFPGQTGVVQTSSLVNPQNRWASVYSERRWQEKAISSFYNTYNVSPQKKLAKTGLIETLVLTAISILSESEIKSETIHKPIPFLYDLVVILSIHDPNKMWRDTSPDVI